MSTFECFKPNPEQITTSDVNEKMNGFKKMFNLGVLKKLSRLYKNKNDDAQSWEQTLERAIKAIVSIKANHVRTFDTEASGVYSATGFVVDKEQGIILSNRHVVSPGPIVAQAIFRDYEEVELQPIYRDPVHDFGFFRFDPSKIKFMDLEQIPLSPERAKIGIEIKVVGNDNGEILSILSGTLARLDRRAPEYGVGNYNDFNTFYLQAASGTSGGSSGSPVLDIDGHAVALNAGGETIASSSFYLPLDRVKRALKYVQKGEQAPRGTLQTEFEYTPYDELRHLGLNSSIEQDIREEFPNETGLLVVRIVLPKGPADGLLEPGDILINANQKVVINFTHLFSLIDDSIGKDIELKICRGKIMKDVKLKVQDLHSITPNRYVEVCGEVINELSYMLAHSYSQPVGGPYVSTGGYMISNVNNIPTPNLDALIEVIKSIPDGARIPLKIYYLHDVHKEIVEIIQVDRHWHKFQVAVRDDSSGLWNYETMPPPPAIQSYVPTTAQVQIFDESLQPVNKVWSSFVIVGFSLPHEVSGIKTSEFCGAGFVVSIEPPLIVCDRYTIPTSIGDIFITFTNSVIIPGKILYLHPVYNFVVLTYDKTLLEDTLIKPIELSDINLEVGDSVNLIGLYNYLPVMKKTTVLGIMDVVTNKCSPPRWRAMNVEEIKVDDPIESIGGVLCDDDGKVQGLWLTYYLQNSKWEDITFMKGFPISLIKPTIKSLLKGEIPKIYGIDVEFRTMRIVEAKNHGLSNEWVKKVEIKSKSKHTLLYVLNILDSRSSSGKSLKVGDILLMINGKLITEMSELPDAIHYSEQVDMIVFRDRKEVNIKVETTPYPENETTEIIGWSGALIQESYKAVLEQVRNVPKGVYVTYTSRGSPAYASLARGIWITEIQEKKVENLDTFLKAIKFYEKEMKENNDDNNNDDGYIRIKVISNNDVTDVVTMKLDLHYWNTWRLVEDKEEIPGWKFVDV